MKRYFPFILFLFSAVLFLSCNGNEEKSNKEEQNEKDSSARSGSTEIVKTNKAYLDSVLVPVKDNFACLYGFQDEDGKWVIEPTFTHIFNFRNGRCIVEINDKYGVIDHEGKFVIPLHSYEFSWFTEFKNGYAVIENDNKYGVFTQDGRMVVKPKYHYVYFIRNQILYNMQIDVGDTLNENDLQSGLFRFWNEKGLVGILDSNGNELLPAEYSDISDFEYGAARLRKEKKLGVFSDEGKIVLPAVCDDLGDFGYDYYVFVYSSEGKKGLATRDEMITPAIYEDVQTTSLKNILAKKNGKWGMIDDKGKTILDFKYNMLTNWTNDKLFFVLGKKFGVMDIKTRTALLPPVLDDVWVDRVYEDKNVFTTYKGKTGMIDSSGKIIVPHIYDDYFWHGRNYIWFTRGRQAHLYSVEENYTRVSIGAHLQKTGRVVEMEKSSGDQMGLVDTHGNIILEPLYEIEKYEDLDYFVYKDEKGNCGVINSRGENLSAFLNYTAIQPAITGDYFFVQGKNKKQGICDLNGKIVIDTTYWAVAEYDPEEKCAWVVFKAPPVKYQYESSAEYHLEKVKFGLVDSTGKILLPAIYDFPASVYIGKTVVSKDNKWGVITKTGKTILPFEYNHIYWEEDILVINKNDKYGLASSNGKIITEPVYEHIGEFTNGFARVDIGNEQGIINTKGQYIIPLAEDALIYSKKDLLNLFYTENNFENINLEELKNKTGEMAKLIRNYCFSFISQPDEETKSYNQEVHFYDEILFFDGNYNRHPDDEDIYYYNDNRSGISVDWMTGNMFSVTMSTAINYDGEMNYDHRMFEYKDNKLHTITTDSIFDSTTDYPELLNQMLLEEIRYEESLNVNCLNPTSVFEMVENSFSLSKEGITFYFDALDDSGEQVKVFFPYSRLKNILRKNGPVSRL